MIIIIIVIIIIIILIVNITMCLLIHLFAEACSELSQIFGSKIWKITAGVLLLDIFVKAVSGMLDWVLNMFVTYLFYLIYYLFTYYFIYLFSYFFYLLNSAWVSRVCVLAATLYHSHVLSYFIHFCFRICMRRSL